MRCPWTKNIAYAVGLITSDGSLSKDRRHIDLTSSDYELLEDFKRALGLTVKIGKKYSSTSDKPQYRVQFGDVKFYKWLESLGLSPNKSKTIAEIKVPEEFFADFLRGLFDGDGSIWSFWDTRWNNSYMYYVQFSSASPVFILWLKHKLSSLYDTAGSIRNSSSVLQLCFAKRDSQRLLGVMYADENTPRLERKYMRAIEIIQEDPYSKIAL